MFETYLVIFNLCFLHIEERHQVTLSHTFCLMLNHVQSTLVNYFIFVNIVEVHYDEI